MKKQRKLIGVIASQIEASYQAGVMKGISEVAFSHDYDIAVFTMFVKEYAKPMHQVGEMNIYNIINYELLDGIIILPNTIRLPGLLPKLIKDIKTKFSGPVISLDYEIEGFINISIDDTKSIELMTDHLIEHHHKTDLAILTGPKNHPHSLRRLQGFLNSLEKHNLTIDENKIYYGDFWYNEATNVVNQMLIKLPSLPDGIVCASDHMAISICKALKSHNIKVPSDIAITGYDYVVESSVSIPPITSMALNTIQLGRNSTLHLIEILEGIEPTQKPDTISIFKEGGSCGCECANEIIECSKIADNEFLDNFYNAYNYMMEELISADDLTILLQKICYYSYQLSNYDKFFLSLCDNWDYVGCSNETAQNYNTDHYTPKMHLMISKEDDTKIHMDSTFQSSIMIPELWADRKKPSAFYFSPIHFNDRCFGYAVLTFGKPSSLEFCYRDWLRTVGIAFENLRVKNNYKWSNQQLEEYAQIDSLTKIYNRNGFFKYGESFLEEALRDGKELFILMGDLNDLKEINDTYGHVEGDNAIQLSAVAFQRTCSKSEKCFRYGGDEFLLLGTNNYTKTEILLFEKSIQSYLSAYNEISEKPYQISLSLGYWHGHVDNQHTLDDYINLADKAMFDTKQRIKLKTGKRS